MATRQEFSRRIAEVATTHLDRALAFLWYYGYSQEYEERSPAELAGDLHDEGFPRPNVTRLRDDLRKSPFAVRGSRKGSYKLDLRRKGTLDEQYQELLNIKVVKVTSSVLNPGLVANTRGYLVRLVHQINGTYDFGFFDGTAVLCRRLMESLLIEVYIHEKRTDDIRQGGAFFQLERLITYIQQDSLVVLSRNAPKTMTEIKQLGDTAAHDRVYTTQQADIDDLKARFRRLIQELLALSGIRT